MFRLSSRPVCVVAALLLACGGPGASTDDRTVAEWPEWGGDKGGLHYSPLGQITPANVDRLELAWTHRSGDFYPGDAERASTALQVTPLVVNETLYYCTPYMRVFALDPETGEERWSFDPELKAKEAGGPYPLTCRGVAYWEDASGDPAPATACQRRLLYGTRDSELIALDADTGEPCADFGDNGRVALREGIGPAEPWEYYTSSPPQILGDTAVVGALVADQLRTDAPSGVVRAFDVRSGTLLWAWDPVPPGFDVTRAPREAWQRGTPNVWSLLSGDPERGLVFVPTGNASPDSYGGERRGLDHYSSSVVALDVTTGKPVWHFQTVHHDVWDYDVGTQPTLVQIPGVGGGRPAVIQPTKMGHVFILDRETGEPLYPVEERPVPQGGVPGETLSPTQPFPTHPPPLHDTTLTPDHIGYTFMDRGECRELLAQYRYDGIFTPPTLEGSIQYPHTAGGMNWGGVAIDPERGLMITNQTHIALVAKLIPRAEYDKIPAGSIVYPQEAYPMAGTPYGVQRFPFGSSFGSPCNPPPWGTLTAVDLKTGETRWSVTLGSTRDQAPFPLWAIPGLGDVGAPNFGGGMATASGLYFIGATTDYYFRAYDVETGELLWRTRIPTQANASPLSYRLSPEGKQYVVVAAGANPLSGPGDSLLAFALPD